MIALRGPNPQDHAKEEDIALLVRFTESGCANEKIKESFEQLTNEQIKVIFEQATKEKIKALFEQVTI